MFIGRKDYLEDLETLWRGTVHIVEVADGRGDRDERRRVVQFLLHALAAEDALQFCRGDGLLRLRIEERRGLLLHVRAEVVPESGKLRFAQVGLIGSLSV